MQGQNVSNLSVCLGKIAQRVKVELIRPDKNPKIQKPKNPKKVSQIRVKKMIDYLGFITFWKTQKARLNVARKKYVLSFPSFILFSAKL
jgi:hypothetical protein